LRERMTLRDALSELIGSGVERGVVVSDTGDGVRGTLSIETIRRLSSRAEAGLRDE
jgi:osmoprotectant transport system ATP-binding protein